MNDPNQPESRDEYRQAMRARRNTLAPRRLVIAGLVLVAVVGGWAAWRFSERQPKMCIQAPC
jgi:hypothetical protein